MRRSSVDPGLHGEPATARLSAFGSLETSELAGLAQLAGAERSLERGETLWEEGKRLPALFVLLDGWMVSQVRVGGDRDMTVKVHLPGDVLGLPSLAYATAAETTTALTPAKLRPLALHSFGHLFEAHPRIAAMMFLVSQQERMSLTDRLVTSWTADVDRRLAGLVCQLHERVRRAFPETDNAFHLPLTRSHVADMIGVRPGALAAALNRLRSADVLGWTGQYVTLPDPEALLDIAGLPTRRLAQDAHWLPAIEQDGDNIDMDQADLPRA